MNKGPSTAHTLTLSDTFFSSRFSAHCAFVLLLLSTTFFFITHSLVSITLASPLFTPHQFQQSFSILSSPPLSPYSHVTRAKLTSRNHKCSSQWRTVWGSLIRRRRRLHPSLHTIPVLRPHRRLTTTTTGPQYSRPLLLHAHLADNNSSTMVGQELPPQAQGQGQEQDSQHPPPPQPRVEQHQQHPVKPLSQPRPRNQSSRP